MKKIVLKLVFILLAIIVLSCDSKSKESSNETSNKIEFYLQKIEEQGFSGTVLVSVKGQKTLSKGYGDADEEKQIPNSPNTIFDIGSITKQFTAAGILKLEMQGKLSVNDKITKYFDNVPEDKQEITIHYLLTHSAGFPGGIGDDYEEISEENFVLRAFETSTNSDIGKTYNYSNVGYSLLAIIIEKVSNKTYEEYLNENLFLPAKMNQTGYLLPEWNEDNIAVGYLSNTKSWGKPNSKKWNPDGPYLHLKGNGGILSTTEDMYKWHLALLNETILSDEAKKKYYTPYIVEGDGAGSYYAYGWAIFPTPRNTNLIAHNGGNGIFFADFWRYLTEDITIIIMTNKSSSYADIITSQIAGIILNPKFESILPNDMEDTQIGEVALDSFVKNVVTTLQNGNEEIWSVFIPENSTKNFIEMAPLEMHISYFNKFKEKLKGGEIVGMEIQNEEITVNIKTIEKEFNLIIIVSQRDDKLLIDGLGIDE